MAATARRAPWLFRADACSASANGTGHAPCPHTSGSFTLPSAPRGAPSPLPVPRRYADVDRADGRLRQLIMTPTRLK